MLLRLHQVKHSLELLAISLFCDLTFSKQRLGAPRFKRAALAFTGLLALLASGFITAFPSSFFLIPADPIAKALALLGLGSMIAASFRRPIDIKRDLNATLNILRERRTLISDLDDDLLLSAQLEVLVLAAHESAARKNFKEAEHCITYALELWRESLLRKGLSLWRGSSAREDRVQKLWVCPL